MNEQRPWYRGWRGLTMLGIALVMGANLIQPAVAHLTTFRHLKDHFYTKTKADERFIDVTETALNAENLDGRDASAFLSRSEAEGSFLARAVYKRESPVAAGTQITDGTWVAAQACDPGDQLLSGGPANVAATSDLIESFPTPGSTNSWSARIDKNGVADPWNVVVLCVNQV